MAHIPKKLWFLKFLTIFIFCFKINYGSGTNHGQDKFFVLVFFILHEVPLEIEMFNWLKSLQIMIKSALIVSINKENIVIWEKVDTIWGS